MSTDYSQCKSILDNLCKEEVYAEDMIGRLQSITNGVYYGNTCDLLRLNRYLQQFGREKTQYALDTTSKKPVRLKQIAKDDVPIYPVTSVPLRCMLYKDDPVLFDVPRPARSPFDSYGRLAPFEDFKVILRNDSLHITPAVVLLEDVIKSSRYAEFTSDASSPFKVAKPLGVGMIGLDLIADLMKRYGRYITRFNPSRKNPIGFEPYVSTKLPIYQYEEYIKDYRPREVWLEFRPQCLSESDPPQYIRLEDCSDVDQEFEISDELLNRLMYIYMTQRHGRDRARTPTPLPVEIQTRIVVRKCHSGEVNVLFKHRFHRIDLSMTRGPMSNVRSYANTLIPINSELWHANQERFKSTPLHQDYGQLGILPNYHENYIMSMIKSVLNTSQNLNVPIAYTPPEVQWLFPSFTEPVDLLGLIPSDTKYDSCDIADFPLDYSIWKTEKGIKRGIPPLDALTKILWRCMYLRYNKASVDCKDDDEVPEKTKARVLKELEEYAHFLRIRDLQFDLDLFQKNSSNKWFHRLHPAWLSVWVLHELYMLLNTPSFEYI